MIRYYLLLVILFTSVSSFAFDLNTPLTAYKGRYSVQWWDCSRPIKAGLSLINRIVIYDTTMTFASCRRDDLACETDAITTQLLIRNRQTESTQFAGHFSGFARTDIVDYGIDLARSQAKNELELSIQMRFKVGGRQDVTCRTVLNPIF